MIVRRLNERFEKKLFEFMDQDNIRHFWGIYDLLHMRDNVNTWIALSPENILGYLMEINGRIIHIRGVADCATPLLKKSELRAPLFNIEPNHLNGVKKLYTGFKPTDATSRGNITTYLSMEVKPQEFRSTKTRGVRTIGKEDAEAVSNLLSRTPERIKDLTKGLAYGLFNRGLLEAFAAAPEVLEDIAIIRGVYTMPTLRGKGYATKTCSALIGKIIEEGREAFLYVSDENDPALHVYRKLGFRETGHIFLSFYAQKR